MNAVLTPPLTEEKLKIDAHIVAQKGLMRRCDDVFLEPGTCCAQGRYGIRGVDDWQDELVRPWRPSLEGSHADRGVRCSQANLAVLSDQRSCCRAAG